VELLLSPRSLRAYNWSRVEVVGSNEDCPEEELVFEIKVLIDFPQVAFQVHASEQCGFEVGADVSGSVHGYS